MRRSERGNGKLATLFWLAVIGALVYVGMHAGPAFYDNYDFKDKMLEFCRLPKGSHSDDRILDMIMDEVKTRGLAPYVKRSNFRLYTSENSRKIRLEYEREAEVLPGFKKVFHFVDEVNQPLLY